MFLKFSSCNFKDYENNKISDKIECQDFVKGNVSYVDINNILPEYINVALKEGINYFNTIFGLI